MQNQQSSWWSDDVRSATNERDAHFALVDQMLKSGPNVNYPELDPEQNKEIRQNVMDVSRDLYSAGIVKGSLIGALVGLGIGLAGILYMKAGQNSSDIGSADKKPKTEIKAGVLKIDR